MTTQYYQIDWTDNDKQHRIYTTSNNVEAIRSDYQITTEITVAEIPEKSIPRVRAFRFLIEREDGSTYYGDVETSFKHSRPTRDQLIAEFDHNQSALFGGQPYAAQLLGGDVLCAEWGTVMNPTPILALGYAADLPVSFKRTRIDKMPGTDEAVAARRARLAELKAEKEAEQEARDNAERFLREIAPEGTVVRVETRQSKNGSSEYARFWVGDTEITGAVGRYCQRDMHNRATKEERTNGIRWDGLQYGTLGQLAHKLYGNGSKLIKA